MPQSIFPKTGRTELSVRRAGREGGVSLPLTSGAGRRTVAANTALRRRTPTCSSAPTTQKIATCKFVNASASGA